MKHITIFATLNKKEMKTKIYKGVYSKPKIEYVLLNHFDMICLSGGAGFGTETYPDPWTKSDLDDLVF